jgi:hypothetical protein
VIRQALLLQELLLVKKSDVLNRLQARYQEWLLLLDRIGPERLDQPDVNGSWSMKDLVAHLTAWNGRLVAFMQAARRGATELPHYWPAHLQTEDQVNAWIYESNRQRPVQDVLDEMDRTHQQLVAIIDALPDDTRIEVVEPKYILMWLGEIRFPVTEFFDHYDDDHAPDVDAWLARHEEQ